MRYLVRKEDTRLRKDRFYFLRRSFNTREEAQEFISSHCPPEDYMIFSVVSAPEIIRVHTITQELN